MRDLICPHCGKHFPSNGGMMKYDHHLEHCGPRKPVPTPDSWIAPGYVLIVIGLAILATAGTLYYRGSGSPDLWWLVMSGGFLVAFGVVDVREGGL